MLRVTHVAIHCVVEKQLPLLTFRSMFYRATVVCAGDTGVPGPQGIQGLSGRCYSLRLTLSEQGFRHHTLFNLFQSSEGVSLFNALSFKCAMEPVHHKMQGRRTQRRSIHVEKALLPTP